MFKYEVLCAVAMMVTWGVPNNSSSRLESWQVDAGHSDAQLITDATTDYGKTKSNVTIGYARLNGRVVIDNDNLAKSSFDLRFYPSTAMSPVIDEDGKFLNRWLADLSNHTLVCFHSKRVVRTPDGRLQATGELAVTRVDRDVDADPTEAYSGPVYGPPMIHRISREGTFIFDFPAAGNGQKESSVKASGSTSMFREDFPQLLKTVVNTYWPTVVQDEKCQNPGATEAYSGPQCTGTFLEAPGLPGNYAANAEDIGVSQDFNSIVGSHLNILVHLRLTPSSQSETAVNGN